MTGRYIEVEKAGGPDGSPSRIRSGAILLPAPLRSDGQHSSSQLLIPSNDARWISSPSGRYSFRSFMEPAAPLGCTLCAHALKI